ncbi:MAG: hypothetical protein JW782_02740 [Candidatus Saganbacteria bacterium]|nr:hypothetical protein [Candidatus Saganbacteria bacterium]
MSLSYKTSGAQIPPRFTTFMFRQTRYVAHFLAADETKAPMRLRVKKRNGGLNIQITSGQRDSERIIPAEVIFPTVKGIGVIETHSAENIITLDPYCGFCKHGAMPTSIKSLAGLLTSRGIDIDKQGDPLPLCDKLVSAVFFNDLRDFIDRDGRIDHVALLVGEVIKSRTMPRYAAQMIFSTVAEWKAFDSDRH